MNSTLSKKLIKLLRKPCSALARLCQRCLDNGNDHSYDFYKNGENELLMKISTINPKVIFDVGANVGEWSLIARSIFPHAEIHCFELSGQTFKTLESKLGGDGFTLNNVGLSDKSGIFEYKDYGDNSGVNTLLLSATYHDQHIPPKIIKANLTTGLAYCESNNIKQIDFLKIDVEGAEHLVLKGFYDLLCKGVIRAVQFEYGYTNGDSKFLMRDFFDFFASCGYIVARIRKGSIIFRDWVYKDNDFTSGPNYVAIRKDDGELRKLLFQ